jgi:RimJ/RimL family protein N-acetyltransferase
MSSRIEGPHINLRHIRKSDAVDHCRHFRDRTTSRNTFVPYPYTMADALTFIRFSQRARKQSKYFHFGIENKQTGRIIGGIALMKVDRTHRKAELGFWIARPYRRRGLTQEAIHMILRFGFGELKLNRIYADVFTRNVASARLLEKCGFTREGTLRRTIKKDNRWIDKHIYAMLRGEYGKAHGGRSGSLSS